MTTLQRTEKHVLFVLVAKRPIIFSPKTFQPIKALWGFIKQQIKLKNLKSVIKSRTEEVFVISERKTNTGCAQRELMEEQEILYNKGIFIKL